MRLDTQRSLALGQINHDAVISGEADIGLWEQKHLSAYQEGATDPGKTLHSLPQRVGNFLAKKMPILKWEDLKGRKVLGGRKGGMTYTM